MSEHLHAPWIDPAWDLTGLDTGTEHTLATTICTRVRTLLDDRIPGIVRITAYSHTHQDRQHNRTLVRLGWYDGPSRSTVASWLAPDQPHATDLTGHAPLPELAGHGPHHVLVSLDRLVSDASVLTLLTTATPAGTALERGDYHAAEARLRDRIDTTDLDPALLHLWEDVIDRYDGLHDVYDTLRLHAEHADRFRALAASVRLHDDPPPAHCPA